MSQFRPGRGRVVALVTTVAMLAVIATSSGPAPQAAAAPPVLAYVGLNSNIAVIDTSTDQIIDLIELDSYSVSDVSVSPTGTRVYATILGTNGGPGTLAVIDTATNAVIARVPVGVEPHGIAPTRDGATVYVAVNGGGMGPPMGVWVVDTASNTVADIIDLEALPSAVSLSGDDSCLFVGHLAGAFSVVHPATRTVVSTFALEGAGIDSMVLSPKAPIAFVANAPGSSGGVARVNVASHSLQDVPLPGHNIQVVALRPGTNELWATATEEGFFVLDATNGALLAHRELPGSNVVGIDFTPDGSKAYIVDSGTSSVLVIDTQTRLVTGQISTPVGGYSKGHFITFPAAAARAADAACRPIHP